MARYPKPKANDWVQPKPEGYRMACCDCCLVHEMDFRVHDGHVQFRVRRNNRSTALMRRQRGVVVK